MVSQAPIARVDWGEWNELQQERGMMLPYTAGIVARPRID
jgi:hypothetical protein